MLFVLLDSYPLSLLSNPANRKECLDCRRWVNQLTNQNILVVVPGIVDYELRRKLIHVKKTKGLENLTKLRQSGLIYAPNTMEVMDKAAQLWAWAKNTGQSTANNDRLDADVILAAQAIVMMQDTCDYAVIATSNVKHLRRYTYAMFWSEITPHHCLSQNRPSQVITVKL